MKQGRFFRIPERPDDIQQLWEESVEISVDSLPDWLDQESSTKYRLVGDIERTSLSPKDQQTCTAELEDLELCGLVVDIPNDSPDCRRVYLRRPRAAQVWSLGMFGGESPDKLSPLPDVRNPILARSDVTDVPAAFLGDPFLVREAGQWHLFFEVLNWRSGKGEIAWATSSDLRTWKYQQIVLAENFHLSYPQVFRWQGEYYLVPESHADQSVRLYRATNFPTEWKLDSILLQGGNFQDPTIFQHGGYWWLFTETSPEIQNDTPRLYFAQDLRGPWQEHPKSPLRAVPDARYARPAGRVISWNGLLWRFVQDCSEHYGQAVRALRIDILTPMDYAETAEPEKPLLAAGAEPWRAEGMHHLDAHQLTDGTWIAAVDGWYWGQCGW